MGVTLSSGPSPEEHELVEACEAGTIDEVRTMLAAGVSADARGKGKWTALMQASQNGHVDVVRMLLDAGANVDARVDGK